ncbi:siroheme synthase CysG [Oceanospirillum sediminis]|uniref:Uroporphyrinogen-III C-methyltransferase n=1 Tax=Oceanospirillum sediminis TaxID=2760088 RepID=A0A839IWM4_9GAMM|nr:siroheme synthase CysG [Oceanospirillum sediminis]MBB1488486.1 uroporphyrinogen-III C-methyltransferase [Oceanospirillum sediminis]
MKMLPLMANTREFGAVIIGHNKTARRKLQALLRADTLVAVASEQTFCDSLQTLIDDNKISVVSVDDALNNQVRFPLVILAEGGADWQREQAIRMKAQGRLVNVADHPEMSNVSLPYLIDRHPVVIAVGSTGEAPVLARIMRSKLEALIPASFGRLSLLVSSWNEKVRAVFPVSKIRERFWSQQLQGAVGELMMSGREKQAHSQLETNLQAAEVDQLQGEVYLVGAGPGDPELLTLRAVRLIQQADVVLYDRLVAPEIVDLCRSDAERIYVGKARADHAVPQGEINQLLVDLAQEGKRVLRLKGGDPFIFGRGGEEIDKLSQHKVPFQVVPGITAAAGCAAYAGIPLTHRDYAQSVRFVTGHLKDGTTNLPWSELASSAQTVVFYMGLVGLPEITRQLIAHGRAEDTPMALIQQGTTRNQRNIIATLGTMVEHIADKKVEPPTLIIVGEVVSLHAQLNWFDPEQAGGSSGFWARRNDNS